MIQPLDAPLDFIRGVEWAGLVGLADKLHCGDWTIPEVGKELARYPRLYQEFALLVRDWEVENNLPEDEAPEYYPD